MWLRAARNARRARGFAVVLALLNCAGTLDWGHAGDDDPGCAASLVQHDHAAHRLGAAPTNASSPAGHCYICHSLRLLHAALRARGGRVIVDLPSAQHRQADRAVPRSARSAILPSRAPPSTNL
jgi:hypothetical protein